jgi:hypothetical protein
VEDKFILSLAAISAGFERHGRQRDAEEVVSNGGESPELSINTRDTVTVSHSISEEIFTVN